MVSASSALVFFKRQHFIIFATTSMIFESSSERPPTFCKSLEVRGHSITGEGLVRSWRIFFYQEWMELNVDPLFVRVEKSLRFLTWNSSKFLYTDK